MELHPPMGTLPACLMVAGEQLGAEGGSEQ